MRPALRLAVTSICGGLPMSHRSSDHQAPRCLRGWANRTRQSCLAVRATVQLPSRTGKQETFPDQTFSPFQAVDSCTCSPVFRSCLVKLVHPSYAAQSASEGMSPSCTGYLKRFDLSGFAAGQGQEKQLRDKLGIVSEASDYKVVQELLFAVHVCCVNDPVK